MHRRNQNCVRAVESTALGLREIVLVLHGMPSFTTMGPRDTAAPRSGSGAAETLRATLRSCAISVQVCTTTAAVLAARSVKCRHDSSVPAVTSTDAALGGSEVTAQCGFFDPPGQAS
jgi:hypothetical protein